MLIILRKCQCFHWIPHTLKPYYRSFRAWTCCSIGVLIILHINELEFWTLRFLPDSEYLVENRYPGTSFVLYSLECTFCCNIFFNYNFQNFHVKTVYIFPKPNYWVIISLKWQNLQNANFLANLHEKLTFFKIFFES